MRCLKYLCREIYICRKGEHEFKSIPTLAASLKPHLDLKGRKENEREKRRTRQAKKMGEERERGRYESDKKIEREREREREKREK